jgi:hypothetical protein
MLSSTKTIEIVISLCSQAGGQILHIINSIKNNNILLMSWFSGIILIILSADIFGVALFYNRVALVNGHKFDRMNMQLFKSQTSLLPFQKNVERVSLGQGGSATMLILSHPKKNTLRSCVFA